MLCSSQGSEIPVSKVMLNYCDTAHYLNWLPFGSILLGWHPTLHYMKFVFDWQSSYFHVRTLIQLLSKISLKSWLIAGQISSQQWSQKNGRSAVKVVLLCLRTFSWNSWSILRLSCILCILKSSNEQMQFLSALWMLHAYKDYRIYFSSYLTMELKYASHILVAVDVFIMCSVSFFCFFVQHSTHLCSRRTLHLYWCQAPNPIQEVILILVKH